MSARLDEFRIECGIVYVVTAETEPFGDHLLRHLLPVQQIFRILCIGPDLFLVQLMSIDRFIIAGVTFLNTPYRTIVNDAHPFDGMVVVFIGNRKGVEGFVNLAAELIFRVIDKHHRKRIASVLHITLCLHGNHRTDTKDG